jgi:hypothetical protein
VYRVVTTYRDSGSARPVVERGPWHPTPEAAEYWADVLRGHGYVVNIETQFSGAMIETHTDNHALADALASMA